MNRSVIGDRLRELTQSLSIYSDVVPVFLIKILGVVMGVSATYLVSRYFGLNQLGAIVTFNTLLTVFAFIGQFGSNVYVLKTLPLHMSTSSVSGKHFLKKTLELSLAFSVLIGCIIFFFSDFIANKFFHQAHVGHAILFLALLLPLRVISAISNEAIRSHGMFLVYAICSILQSIFLFLGLIIFITLFHREGTLLLVNIISWVLGSIFCLLSCWFIVTRGLSRDVRRQVIPIRRRVIFRESLPLLLMSSSLFLLSQMDTIMLAYLSNTGEVGNYAVAVKISMVVALPLIAINALVGSKVSSIYLSEGLYALQKFGMQATGLMFLSALPLFLVVFILREYLSGLFGANSIENSIFLLSMGHLFNAFIGPVGYMLSLTDHAKIYRNILGCGLIINVLLNYILIPKYGASGAAFATFTSVIFWNCLAAYFVKSRMKISLDIYGFTALYRHIYKGFSK